MSASIEMNRVVANRVATQIEKSKLKMGRAYPYARTVEDTYTKSRIVADALARIRNHKERNKP